MRIELCVSPPGATQLLASQINRELEESLGRRLRSAGHSNEAESLKLVRQNPNAQDLGSIVSVVLAAPAIIELARGIADYLRRLAPKDRKIVLNGGEIKIELSNPTPEDLTKAISAFLEGSTRGGDVI
jgi:hypothetical protein